MTYRKLISEILDTHVNLDQPITINLVTRDSEGNVVEKITCVKISALLSGLFVTIN